ncbi:MAG: DUF4085 family protein [Ruminococcaceae bacterium]|nr:DUF4085 family protein [Oscillospiraceae bacterium]
MKYMTKEWYETAQKTSFHLLLKVSKKAESFSEDYFKQLYKRKEKEWLDVRKAVSEVPFEDIFPEEFHAEYFDGTPIEKSIFEEMEKDYFERREQARINFQNIPAFDAALEKKNFHQSFLDHIKRLRENLPESILQKVADIRVLALDFASREIKQEITQFCKQNGKMCESAMTGYQKQYEKQFKSGIPDFAEELQLHDCILLSCRKKGKDIVLTLDNSGSFTNISEIRMKNSIVLTQDSPLHGAWCLYTEIYPVDNRYEIHFLLLRNKLIDFIVSTDGLEYRYD